MSLEVKRLHLASLQGPEGDTWPVHGFVVTHPGGAVLVDTGVGGPERLLNDWRVVNRSMAEALGDLDMSPADIDLVINTHLHFDHCGQNAVFKHAPHYVQRTEVDRAQRESPSLYEWFDFMNARFELLDGDAEVVPGLSVVTTPGHTVGHQSVLISSGGEVTDVLLGDAAYQPRFYTADVVDEADLIPGQASDVQAWGQSLDKLRSLDPARVHFCHHTDVLHR